MAVTPGSSDFPYVQSCATKQGFRSQDLTGARFMKAQFRQKPDRIVALRTSHPDITVAAAADAGNRIDRARPSLSLEE